MELTLKRDVVGPDFTLGKLSVDGVFFCYTVEDTIRDVKVAGKTAIPFGRYKVILNMSNRFQKIMPLLLDVPNYEGVRIHSGNTAADTEGCIIVGMERTKDGVALSRICWEKLMEKLKDQAIMYINII